MLWRLGWGSLFLALLVFSATGWELYSNWSEAQQDAQLAESNRFYLRTLNDILGYAKDAETGQRGYILTGRERYLDPYYKALAPLESSLRSLSSVAEKRPDQREAIGFIQSETRLKLHELALTVTLRRDQGLSAALAEVLTDRGRIAMDQIRLRCNRTAEVVAADEAKRTRDASNHQLNSIVFAAGGGTTIFLLMVAGFLALTSGAKQEAQLAERLADSKEILETTLTSIGDGVIATDTVGQIMFINPEAAKLTGWSREEALGKRLEDVFHIVNETTRARVESPFEKVMRSCTVMGLANHTILIGKDGSEVPIDDSGAPIRNGEGKINGVVLVFRNIVERRKTEASLRLSHEELLKANEELRQFSYAATHDLQEPLRTIVIFSQLVARNYKQTMDARGQHIITTLEEAARRMSSLVEGLLTYTRAGETEDSGRLVAVNASEILSDTVMHLHGAIEESGAIITYDELPTVLSDPAQLSHVFQNLLSNAIKYRRPGITAAIHVSATIEGPRATFRVSDNGMGFKQEYADRIFLLFQRLHGRSTPGTGIGLALCRRIIERHGGRIWARSEENQGTSFFFTVPLAEQ